YTQVVKLERAGEIWRVVLLDTLNCGVRATVSAKLVLNTSGIWIDRVNKSAQPAAKRRITGTKGVADVMGWDEKRIAEEAERYLAYVARTYAVRVSAPAKAA